MSRNMFAAAIALALLTGGVVGQLAAVGPPQRGRLVAESDHRIELARAFYEGMNAYLVSGDDGFLRLIAPGFQDVGVLDAEPQPASSLVARLDALRAGVTPPVFEIEAIEDLGHSVQVRLTTGLPVPLETAGFTVTGPASSQVIEFLQIQGNSIVTRWGQDDLIPRIERSLAGAYVPLGAALLTVETRLVTLDSGAEWRPEPADAAWMIVEHGSIDLEGNAGVDILDEGHGRSDVQTVRRISNRARDASAVWYVSISIDRSTQALLPGNADANTPGVTISLRAWSTLIGTLAGPERIRVELARVTVPPGTDLQTLGDARARHVVVIDGMVDCTIGVGELFSISEREVATTVRDQVTIPAGGAAATLPGASASCHAIGTNYTELLLLTVAQVD